MASFDQKQFLHFIIDNNVVGFFNQAVTLKSGRQSHWYVNWRTVSSDVFLIDKLTDFLISFVSDLGLAPESFYGVPEGATKLGVISTYKLAKQSGKFHVGSHALPMGRGKVKEHGAPKDRYFVGAPRGDIVVVEDVTTTGGSICDVLGQLAQTNVRVLAAVGLTNRMERRDDGKTVEEAVAKFNVPYYAMSDALKFLPEAYRAFAPGEIIGRAIEKEFEEYGVEKISLVDGRAQ